MTDVQIGTMVFDSSRPNPYPSKYIEPVKFEDGDNWNLADLCLARGITELAVNNPKGQVLFSDLVTRLRNLLHIDEAYIVEAVPKLLRNPPTGPSGTIASLSFRRD